MPLLATNISKRFGNNWALRDVSFETAEGRILGIFGPTASGKTTLLETLAGQFKPSGGTISVDGSDVTRIPAKHRGITYHNGSGQRSAFSGFGGRAKVSSGEAQLGAFEHAMAEAGPTVLLDDPFRKMDREMRRSCFDNIRDAVHKGNRTMIFASSDFDQISQLANDAVVLVKGEIVQVGTPQDIYEKPETVDVARLSGENNIFPARRISSTNADLPEFHSIEGGHRIFAQPVAKSKLGSINQNVMLAIRPEQVAMSLGASFPEDNLIKAVVSAIEFLGPTSLISFDAGGLKVKARVFRVVGLEIGVECMIGLPPHRIQVLKD